MDFSGFPLCFVAVLLLGLVSAESRVPTTPGVCWAMGDPHYHTFDGELYPFMGSCTYVLAKNHVVDKTHPAFEVIMKNSQKANSELTALSRLNIKVYGYEIRMQRDGMVWINNEIWNLPAKLTHSTGYVDLDYSGLSMILSTDFGMTIHYDWKSYVRVTVPSTFMRRMRGLCGDFNGVQNNLIKADGSSTTNITEFARSWRVPNQPGDKGCRDQCIGNCLTCNPEKSREARYFCRVLSTILHFQFGTCGNSITPAVLNKICKFDYCQGVSTESYTCNQLQIYTDSCQRAGTRVNNWRGAISCTLPVCPEHSHFEHCGSACPATCQNPTPPSDCKLPCLQTCVCDSGYIRSGNKCVLPKDCGCNYKGRYLQSGQTIWASKRCTKKVICEAGKTKMEDSSCGFGQVCGLKDGVRGCQTAPSGVCTISGDPHYRTFDGQTYDFMGTCAYVVAEYHHHEGADLTPFSVVVGNEKWSKNPKTSVAKLVAVTIFDTTVFLRREQYGLAMVNGVNMNLPLSIDGLIVIEQIGRSAVISTSFGLKVTYDLVYHVTVLVPGMYASKTSGLCGNFNNNKDDDFRLRDGTITTDVNVFGGSWKVDAPGVVCESGCIGNKCPTCARADKSKIESDCAIITNPQGPFASCHAIHNPWTYYQDCVYDVCAAGYATAAQTRCQSINAYVLDCQDVGVTILNWRTPKFCPFSCPAYSQYSICASPCKTPCPGLANIACAAVCAEGCACNSGYYFTGTSCVPYNQCGCYINGKTLKVGHEEVSEDCKTRYTCPKQGAGSAAPMSCKADETCGVKDGLRGCYHQQCTLGRNGALNTFDGRAGVIERQDLYDLVMYCDDNVQEGWFRIMTDLQHCRRTFKMTVVGIFAFFDDMSVIINSQFTTWINGRRVNLPFKNGISIRVSNKHLVLEKKSVVTVLYSETQDITVTIGKSYADKVCGACGRPSPGNDLLTYFQTSTLALTPVPFTRCGKGDEPTATPY